MVEQTNIYVKPHIAKAGPQKKYSKLNERKTVTVDKVRIYITLLIYRGILWNQHLKIITQMIHFSQDHL